MRPFCDAAQVHHRGMSRPLQRAVTDFAADVSFAQAVDKVVEHYGVLLNESSIRRVTERHAEQMHTRFAPASQWPQVRGAEVVIGEMDGSMIPIMEVDESQPDRRKGKVLSWREAKLSLAHAKGSRDVAYGGTVQGGARGAGRSLLDCAIRSGFGRDSELHGVGDGAEWIALQVEEQFGSQGHYLIDFYHVCEYLSAAAKRIGVDEAASKAWLSQHKACLKAGRVDEVIEALEKHVEADDIVDTEAPVRGCHRYLCHRRGQLDYLGAIEKELPIGSGEIESAHRYVIQQRLKRPGAWWRIENAEHMLSLRLNRANRQWAAYWVEEMKLAA